MPEFYGLYLEKSNLGIEISKGQIEIGDNVLYSEKRKNEPSNRILLWDI